MHIIIDEQQCTGCGECVRVCPSGVLSLQGGKAVHSGRPCLECDHCAAVCPAGAVRNLAGDSWPRSFATFQLEDEWIAHGEFPAARLVQLMASRRSCRNFLQRPVPKGLLEDLVRAGITAPSGTNSQKWTFTLVPTREDVVLVGELVGSFFGRLNRMARRAWLCKLLKMAGKPELDGYRQRHLDAVEQALQHWENTGEDLLFHGAPALILVGSLPGGSCPAEDALLATQNMLLAAHCLGLGSCLIGYAVEALRRDPAIGRRLGLRADESIHAVIALGYPNEHYQRLAGRKKPLVRVSSQGG
ncbi:MAG: nitroreductase family protein [Desulfohalobiaceae bacterium]